MPLPTVDLRPYFVPLVEMEGVLDWKAIFGNDHPVEMDIGCGRGKFLCDSTLAHPETNWLGAELDYTEARRAATRLAKRSLPNGRVIGGDAHELLSKRVEPHSVAAAHVYFPDPWWKRKHHKRRLFQPLTVALITERLRPGGVLHVATDHRGYAEQIAVVGNAEPGLRPARPGEQLAISPQRPATKYEAKARHAGDAVTEFLWVKHP